MRGAAPLLTATVTAFYFVTASLHSQSVQHLTTTQPGGMPGLPVMGGIEQLTNGVRINRRDVKQAVLQHGDRIEIGTTELLFERLP